MEIALIQKVTQDLVRMFHSFFFHTIQYETFGAYVYYASVFLYMHSNAKTMLGLFIKSNNVYDVDRTYTGYACFTYSQNMYIYIIHNSFWKEVLLSWIKITDCQIALNEQTTFEHV